MVPAQWFRLIFGFIVLATSTIVVGIVARTAWVDYAGTCLLDAEVASTEQCNQQCGAAGDVCANGLGTCLGAQQCSVPCFEASTGTRAKCVYVIAGSGAGLLAALLLFVLECGVLVHLRRPIPSGVSATVLALISVLFFAVMAAAAAIQTQGYVDLCRSLDDGGLHCGDRVPGPTATSILPRDYNPALEAALVAAYIAMLFWLLLAVSSLVQLCVRGCTTQDNNASERGHPTPGANPDPSACLQRPSAAQCDPGHVCPSGSHLALMSGPHAASSHASRASRVVSAWTEDSSMTTATAPHNSAADLDMPPDGADRPHPHPHPHLHPHELEPWPEEEFSPPAHAPIAHPGQPRMLSSVATAPALPLHFPLPPPPSTRHRAARSEPPELGPGLNTPDGAISPPPFTLIGSLSPPSHLKHFANSPPRHFLPPLGVDPEPSWASPASMRTHMLPSRRLSQEYPLTTL